MKRRMKEVERERKEREKMGLPSFAGQGSSLLLLICGFFVVLFMMI